MNTGIISRLITIRADPSYPCRSVFYCGESGLHAAHTRAVQAPVPCERSGSWGEEVKRLGQSAAGRRTGMRLTRVDFLASPCVSSPVSAIRMPRLPLLPLWEKGDGGMRGKSAQECRLRRGASSPRDRSVTDGMRRRVVARTGGGFCMIHAGMLVNGIIEKMFHFCGMLHSMVTAA